MDLRVLSLNVWGLPPPVGSDVSERLHRIARRLPDLDVDVVVFQEVWTEESRATLLSAGHTAGLGESWQHGSALGGSGLLALSRLPIRSTRFTPYRLCGLPQRVTHGDFYGGKGFVRLDVEFAGELVAIFGTHLIARYTAVGEVDEYEAHRAGEVIELAAAVREVETPVVAIGDFNILEDSPEYRILLGLTGLVDAAAALGTRQDTVMRENAYRAADGQSKGSRIDYGFTRSGVARSAEAVTFRRVLDEPIEIAGKPAAYSDHAGLLAEIRLAGPGAPAPPPDPAVLETAREILARGRGLTRARRTEERIAAGVALLAGLGSALGSRSAARSRRRFLRAALLGLAGLAWAGTGGLTVLTERFIPEELRGFDEIETLLEQIAASPRAEGQRAADEA